MATGTIKCVEKKVVMGMSYSLLAGILVALVLAFFIVEKLLRKK